MMLGQNEKPTWLQHAADLFVSDRFEDGDIISHEWVKYALKIPPVRNLADADRVQWMLLRRMDAFREWLLVEQKVALKSVRGEGYWIVPPAQQARHAATESMRLVSRGLEKGSQILQHTRFDRLTDEERRKHVDAEAKLAGLDQMMQRGRRDLFKKLGDNR